MSLSTLSPSIPYPGLRPFEAADQPVFFGRELQVGTILRQLEDHRFVAVVGSSGSGKSSLVRAGLLPALREGFLFGVKDWVTLIIKPGNAPYERLATALCHRENTPQDSASGGNESDTKGPSIEEALTLPTLQKSERGLVNALHDAGLPKDRHVIVVVDQFEEVFAFRRATRPDQQEVVSRDEAAAFVNMLLYSSKDPESRVWVVLTMRSDFIGNCEAFLGLPEAVSSSQFLVPRLDRRQMEEAITRPGEVKTAPFQQFGFERDLVNRIINDAGDRPDQLPMMQHALMRTWKLAAVRSGKLTLTLDDYQQVGGIEESLSRHADEAWAKIKDDPKRAQLARRLFLLFCDVSPGGQITRRRPQIKEAMALTGASVDDVGEVMRVFQADDRNFLLSPVGQALTPDTYVEVSHEALLRRWHLFSKWLENEREAVAELRRLVDRIDGRALLQAEELDRVAPWQESYITSLEWAKRYVTVDQWTQVQAFLAESVKDVKRRHDQKRNTLLIILGILLLASGVSFFFFVRAKIAAQKAEAIQRAARTVQDAVSNGFFRTIGVSNQNIPTRDEREALWELAELDRDNAAVRSNLLNRWFGTAEAYMKGEARGGQGFLAATGLSQKYHRRATTGVEELGRLVATALKNPREAYRFSILGNVLASLAAKMEPQAAAVIAKDLAVALENPQGMTADRLSILGDALASLAAKMEPQAARDIASLGARRLAAAMEDPQETSSARLSTLGSALAALATRIEPQETAEIAKGLAAAMENRQETSSARLFYFGGALAALAGKVQQQEAAEIAKGLAAALENPQETSSARLSILGRALTALAGKIEPQAAAEITKGLAAAMENPQETSSVRLLSLGDVLAALAAKMEPRAATEIVSRGARRLAAAMEDRKESDPARLSSLGYDLAALAARMEPQAAAEIASRGARRLAAAMEDRKESDPARLLSLGDALAALAGKMESQPAAEIAKSLAAAMEDPQETSSDRLSSLGYALAALAGKIEPQAAAEIAKSLAAAIENPQEMSSDRSSTLGRALAALATKMKPEVAAEIAQRLTAAIENRQETSSDRLSSLGKALAAVVNKMGFQAAAELASRGAQRLTAAIENPQETDSDRLSSVGDALAALVAKMEPQAAAEVASRGARRLAAAMEDPQETSPDHLSSLGEALLAIGAKMKPQAVAEIAKSLAAAMENPQETSSDRLSGLGDTLAALGAKLEPDAAAEIAKSLAAVMENPQETSSDRLSSLGKALAALCGSLPSARHAYLLALSNMLLRPVSAEAADGEKQAYDRKLLVEVCAKLSPQDLSEVLKYPFSTAEVRQIVLGQLEARTGRNFAGSVWEFVEQATGLGVKDIAGPAKRPSTQDALIELNALRNTVPTF
jgi:hypothetical protein